MLDSNIITWIWLACGILLILSEILIPSAVAIFFGFSALIVALVRWIGLFKSLTASFEVWIITSLVLVITLRRVVKRLFPADSSFQPIEDDSDAYGTIVSVIEPVNDHNNNGRIRYQGTSWPAMTNEGSIPAGKKAKLLCRNNIAWIVEPYAFD